MAFLIIIKSWGHVDSEVKPARRIYTKAGRGKSKDERTWEEMFDFLTRLLKHPVKIDFWEWDMILKNCDLKRMCEGSPKALWWGRSGVTSRYMLKQKVTR